MTTPEITNGQYMEGYSVGYCDGCRKIQSRLYFLDKQRFCASCFPTFVNVKIAREKLQQHEKEKSISCTPPEKDS